MAVMLKDVAEYAKVAPSTASKVLGDRTSAISISAATRDRVFQAAGELGYRPNHIAKSLRTRRTSTIGVVVPDGSAYIKCLQAAEAFAERKGYELLFTVNRRVSEGQKSEINRLLDRQVDGLLVLAPSPGGRAVEELASLAKKGYAVVGVGSALAENVDCVDWDRTGAFKELAEHLLSRGCRKIIFFGDAISSTGICQRVEGIRQAISLVDGTHLQVAHCGQDVNVFRGDHSSDVELEGLVSHVQDQFGREKPDAVMCQTDEFAMLAVRVLHGLGLRVPEDVAVTGSSDTSYGKLMDRPLTTVRMPHETIMHIALTRMIEKIEHPDDSFDRLEKIVPAKVIVRQSSLLGGK